jgi:hypothetical protein
MLVKFMNAEHIKKPMAMAQTTATTESLAIKPFLSLVPNVEAALSVSSRQASKKNSSQSTWAAEGKFSTKAGPLSIMPIETV